MDGGRNEPMPGVVIDRPICMECGHDLSALALEGACPECGTGYTETSRFPPPAPRVMSVIGPVLWRLSWILVWVLLLVGLGFLGLFRSSESDFSTVAIVALIVIAYGLPLIWIILVAVAGARSGRLLCARMPRMTRRRALIPGIPLISRAALAQIAGVVIALLLAVGIFLVMMLVSFAVALANSSM